jgi:serine phosphatase RsbU (regulator of sigma subunit)
MRDRIKTILLLLILVSSMNIISGQDSLTTARMSDSIKAVQLLNHAMELLSGNNNDSALIYASGSATISAENGFQELQARSYELMGKISDSPGEWDDALSYYLRAATAYTKAGNKEGEARIFHQLAARYFSYGVYSKAAYYSEQEFILYDNTGSQSLALSSETAARSYYYLPSDSLSIKWYGAAGHFYLQVPDSASYIRCLGQLGTLYSRAGKFTDAFEIYKNIISFYETRKDYRNLSAALNQAGFLMFHKGDIKSAKDFFNRAITTAERSGKADYFLTDVWSNIAICEQNLGNQEEMLSAFNNALGHAKAAGRTDEAARIERILANIYYNKGDNYHAEIYCLSCIESAKTSANLNVLQLCYKDYSSVLESGNDFVKALEFYEKYLNLRDSLNYAARISEKENSDRIKSLEEAEQRIRNELSTEEIQGLEFRNLKTEARRKENELMLLQKQQDLDRSEKNRLAQSLVLEKERFELNRRAQDIRSLKQQQAIDSLNLRQKSDSARALITQNQLLEKDKLQKETKLKNEKLAKQFAVGIGSLSLLVAIIILYGLISTRKKNQILAESKKHIENINSDLEIKNTEILRQKDIIEQKNQSITDSIQYASRIQAAVLPPIDFLTVWGIENFILYKPKDIVSGDFYWGLKKDGKIILAAGDCTGHGVPGAFMSMLGHAFLDEIVNTKNPEDAASILNMLRDEIINTLKQKGTTGEARDGMDISLVIIDIENGILNYAGANNPVYLIRNGELLKYQADKMPIGIHFINFTPFTNQVIEIRKGDYLYLFSDGYADQFGGPKGRKFMYKQFQDLLLRNYKLAMEQQKEKLDETFEKWKDGYEQVDDVMIIGIRI